MDPGAPSYILAEHLHRPVNDPAVLRAVEAAIALVEIRYTAGVALSDDVLRIEGIVNLAERIYLDPSAPGGQMGAFGDPSFVPINSPEDLLAHVHHYFDDLILYDAEVPGSGWGIA